MNEIEYNESKRRATLEERRVALQLDKIATLAEILTYSVPISENQANPVFDEIDSKFIIKRLKEIINTL